MTAQPRYSIVIPTRNRARTLPYAIQSILNQTQGDFELVISNNNSSDTTKDVVHGFHDDRIRYCETGRDLSMIDSWEFALEQARSEWISYLCDDDAISARLFEEVDRVRELHGNDVISWMGVSYYPNRSASSRPGLRSNEYNYKESTEKILDLPSSAGLSTLFRFETDPSVPKLSNSTCHRSVLDRVRSKLGRVFLPPAPDYTVATATLAVSKRYSYINMPLLYQEASENSPHTTPASFSLFAAELGQVEAYSPIPILSPVNQVAESVLHVKHKMPEDLAGVPDDIVDYLHGFYIGIIRHKSNGFPMDTEERLLEEFLKTQPESVRSRMRSLMRSSGLKQSLFMGVRNLAYSIPGMASIASKFRGITNIRGSEHGFDDILGAVQYSDTLVFGKPRPVEGREPATAATGS